jgi:hypothetical protein
MTAKPEMRTIAFVCDYDTFLDVSGRRNSAENQKLWLEVVAIVNTEHYDTIRDELCEAISLLADDDI